jgi:hypothetical protein
MKDDSPFVLAGLCEDLKRPCNPFKACHSPQGMVQNFNGFSLNFRQFLGRSAAQAFKKAQQNLKSFCVPLLSLDVGTRLQAEYPSGRGVP